jgi:Ca-activated chloride channel family protein
VKIHKRSGLIGLAVCCLVGCSSVSPTSPGLNSNQSVIPAGPRPSGTALPSVSPTSVPTSEPTAAPSVAPTSAPSSTPTVSQTPVPLNSPVPTPSPTPSADVYSYRDNFFKNYGVNPFVETATDRLSTFAADVDTASYTLMRKFLEQNKLPDPASIRTEEFLNYFNFHYPQPASGKFAIQTDIAPSYFGDAQTKIMRVGIQGQEVIAKNRKPAVLTFVIDVSGSMNLQNRLELVKQSLFLLVNQLNANDKVGIVIYGSEARTLLEHTNQKQAILNAISTLRPEGSTNAEAGLFKGFEAATKALQADASNRIILCSDGVANVGATGPEAILARIKQEAGKGIALSTIGFGMGNFNDTLMEQLANQGDGTYAYVDNINEAQRIFVQNLTGTLQTIAKDVKIQVDFNPNVVVQYRLLGYENRDIRDEDFRNDTVDAGEVGSNHSVTALYEVRFQDEVKESNLATVTVRYKDVDENDRVRETSKTVLTSELQSFSNATPSFKLATAVAEYAEILRKSIFAQDGQLKDVSALAVAARDGLPGDAKVVEFVELAQKAELMFNPAPRLSISTIVGGSKNPAQLSKWSDFLAQQLGGGGKPPVGK